MGDLEFIKAVFDFIWNMTIEVSYCIVIIMLARSLTKKFLSAGIRRLFWLIIFVPCLVPWSFYIPLNISALSAAENTISELLPVYESTELPDLPEVITVTEQSYALSDAVDYTENRQFFSVLLQEPQTIFIAVWITGAAGLLIFSCWRNILNSRLATSNTQPVPSWVQEIFLQCRQSLSVKPWPVLVINSNISSPSLMGAIRPYILLPKDIINEKDPDQLRHVLLHELSHLKQGDIWISWGWTFLSAIQWFNPLVWWAGRFMYLDREMSCDEKVLQYLKPDNHQSYGTSLIALFKKINNPNRYPSLASIVEKKTNFERRLLMINRYKPHGPRRSIAGLAIIAALLAVSLTSFASGKPKAIKKEKAELIGRVEHFFMNNFRDISARKSLQWSDVKTDGKGNLSIRYKYEALIWDKDWKIMNQVFTFDADGNYKKYNNVKGFPKNKTIAKADTTTKKGMIALVNKFFSQNWVDITAKKNIQWSEPATGKDGNVSIRCKFEATIQNKKKVMMDKVFTFKPDGQFVSVQDSASSIDIGSMLNPDNTPGAAVSGFTIAAAKGNVKKAMSYMLEGGTDYQDVLEMLNDKSSSGPNYQFKQVLESIDPKVPIKIVSTETSGGADRYSVTWQVTFRKPVKCGKEPNVTVLPKGSTYKFNAKLKKTDKGWLIDGI